MKKENFYFVDEDEWKKQFSDTVNRLLGEKDMSINKVAAAVNVDPKTLRNYIERKSVPSAVMVMKLAKFFNVSIDYLTSGGKCDTGYSDETVAELGTLMKNFDVSLVKDKDRDDTVTLTIKDKIITTILREMYITKSSEDFDSIVQKLAKYYGKMKVFNKNLVDYNTFHSLIAHEYIYHDIEDDVIECINENGEECYGTDFYTFEEIEKRIGEWENMSISEREEWWENYCKSNREEDTL